MRKCQLVIHEIKVSEILIFSSHWPKALYYVFLTCFKMCPVLDVTRSWNEMQGVSWSSTHFLPYTLSDLLVFTGTVLSLYYLQLLINLSRALEITRFTDWLLLKTLERQLYFCTVLLCQNIKLKKVLSVLIIRS